MVSISLHFGFRMMSVNVHKPPYTSSNWRTIEKYFTISLPLHHFEKKRHFSLFLQRRKCLLQFSHPRSCHDITVMIC